MGSEETELPQTPSPQPSPVPPAPSEPTPAPQYTREYVEQLEQIAAAARGTYEQLEPLKDDVERLIQDESYRKFVKEGWDNYQKLQQLAQPQIPPEIKPLADDVQLVKQYVLEQRDREKKAADSERQTKLTTNIEYAKRLVAERPDLGTDNFAGIQMLDAYANARNLTLEEAWKRVGSNFATPTPKAEPPRSLRAGAAAPGVPGPSTEQPIRSAKDLRNRLAANLRAAQGR